METCLRLADRFGIGQVSVDNAFHYLWGGGYVLAAARRGYIAYTSCTAGMAEVVPFQGVAPTLGTNPHSWAFPTQDLVGFPVLVDRLDDAVNNQYCGIPSRLYLVDSLGKIAYKSGRGSFGFKPAASAFR